MPPPAFAAILWDWDNTRADGWPAITDALNFVFTAFAMPDWCETDTRGRARHSVRESFLAACRT